MKKKVAIVCDHISGFGGAERVVLSLAKNYNADVFTGYYEKSFVDFNSIPINSLISKGKYSIFDSVKIYKEFTKLDLDNYDIIIASGNLCLSVAERYGERTYWFCHTPMRRLYNFDKNLSFKSKLVNFIWRAFYIKKDMEYASRVRKILVNSNNVKDRVRAIYTNTVDSDIVVTYAPVSVNTSETDIQVADLFSKYYLSTARLSNQKRIIEILDFFSRNADYNLIILSHGPLQPHVERIAKKHKNIEYVGVVPDQALFHYIRNAIATIYVPVDEDFGISPLESMMLGTPCIGVNEGGIKETVVNKLTGYLVDKVTNDELLKAVNFTDENFKNKGHEECVTRANQFSEEMFLSRVSQAISIKRVD